MFCKRVRFTVEYEVDLDGIPGWGHQVEDWIRLATSDVLRQTHYHTTARATSVEELKKDHGEPYAEQKSIADEAGC